MKFVNPDFLYLLIPVLLIFSLCIAVCRKRRSRMLKDLLGAAAAKSLRVSYFKRQLRNIILGSALILIVFAGSRPYFKEHMQRASARGRDVMVIFDVSKSMLCNDIAPSRLEHAKFMLRELVKSLPGDRFGLIAFAGNAYLSCPLTVDSAAFLHYVRELSCETVPVGGTDLEKAFGVALKSFRAAEGNEHAVVLFTDGEELSGDSAKLASELKKAGIKLFIFGLGDPNGSPVMDENGIFRRDENGKVILSKLNEAKLSKLATDSGGFYFRSSVTDTGLEQSIRYLRRMGGNDYEYDHAIPVERFELFLIAAAILLLLYVVISEVPGKILLLLLSSILVISPLAGEENLSDIGKAVPEEILPEGAAKLYNYALDKQKEGHPGFLEHYENILRDPATPVNLKSKVLLNFGADRHLEAEKTIAEAEKSSADIGKLDPALNLLQNAEATLGEAEKFYAQSMAIPNMDIPEKTMVDNLALLAADRRRAEQLKKKIEDLKEKIRQAQQAAKDAQKENQAGQNKQEKKNNSDKSKSDNSGKDNSDSSPESGNQGNSGENQESKDAGQQGKSGENPSQSALDRAMKATRDLEKSAQELKNQAAAQSAAAAQKDLNDAQAEEKSGDRRAAGEKIDSALQHLKNLAGRSSAQEQKDQSAPSDSGDQKQNQKSGEKGSKESANAAQITAGSGEKSTPDKENAGALLQLMENSEKDFRKQVKFYAPATGNAPVGKDW